MITRESRISDLLKNPIAQDVIGRMELYGGIDAALVRNPLVGRVKISTLLRFARRKIADADAVADTMIDLFNQEDNTPQSAPSPEHAWWKEAVVYQIYPRSFQDGNGDGIGDIRGVIGRLDYLKSLGVDAVWFSPIFDSPNDDNGYDVRDYRAIMREFGTMEDVEELIDKLHARDMRVVFDLVLNHTSDEHPWFIDSAKNPDGPHKDFYYWRGADPGKRPNNWTSFFSGPAWEWSEERGQWYLHLFSKKQPDLNWENPAVREEVYGIINFWRGKGVDGFRLDVINFISKTSLEDGSETLGALFGITGMERYFYGHRLHEFLREARRRGFGDAFTIGESAGTGVMMNKLLTAGTREELSTSFCFDHMNTPQKGVQGGEKYDLNHLKHCFTAYQTALPEAAWPTIFVENHDNPRMVSKIDPSGKYRHEIAKLLATLLLTSRGTVFLYQGQELGAQNVPFSGIDELRDIESLNRYKALLGQGVAPAEAWKRVLPISRDHARTPMQWNGEPGADFSAGRPWIRIGDPAAWNAAEQQGNEHSVLAFYRALIALRKAHPALIYGSFEPVADKRADVFCYLRDDANERFYVEANLCQRTIQPPKRPKNLSLISSNYKERDAALRPYEANLYRVIGR